YMINYPLIVAGEKLVVTCVAVGNPHVVIFVDDFDFDWQRIGWKIERHRLFPNRTNVEFVKVINHRRIRVVEWERGVGATGSSGTGAAAAVCTGVMTGLTDRRCEVVFEVGSLFVEWREDNNTIEVHGPVEFISTSTFEFI
ncbi:MAG: diaminopimelate epimerase, partial [Candidatus Zixiibacteriota bacterium]